MMIGICVGGILHRFELKKNKIKWFDTVVNTTIVYIIRLLLLILGLEMGSDEALISALPTLGLNAFIIATVSVVGSCLAAALLALWIGPKCSIRKGAQGQSQYDNKGSKYSMLEPLKGSAIILAFFALGIVIGLLFNITIPPQTSFYTLAILIFCVGLSIGHNKSIFSTLKELDKRVLLLPLGTILGTLVVAALFSLILPYTSTETLAVASGQAYYSLSSILIAESKGMEIGTLALLANVIREIIALVAAPFLPKIAGPFAPIAAGGATTADTTLPIIRQVCGDELSVVSVYHGFVVDFSVPFMVALFCAL